MHIGERGSSIEGKPEIDMPRRQKHKDRRELASPDGFFIALTEFCLL